MNSDEIYCKGLTFVCTCFACPEQYDVYLCTDSEQKEPIAYVRLRWGRLIVQCPDVGAEVVYVHYFDEDFKGYFKDTEERWLYISEAAEKINEYYETKKR